MIAGATGRTRLKVLPPHHRGRGARLSAWITELRGSGLRTPAVATTPAEGVLEVGWVEGSPLRERILGAPDWRSVTDADLRDLLAPLVHLHRMPAPSDLPVHDRWIRITPRLSGPGEIPDLRATARELADRLRAAESAGDDPIGVVHGDFHAGQVILPFDGGDPWLIDLDDIGRGDAESDVGNLAANLATSTLVRDGIAAAAEALLDRMADLYADTGGSALDSDRLNAALATSLLRRSLKLEERGGPTDRIRAILAAGLGRIG